MTPHNEARPGDYAETVLLPGDPDRAAWIAETLLVDVRRVNTIRGALGFTGSYRGTRVSVQTTGMGVPSLAIYVHELLAVYGAKVLIRVGSCGGLAAEARIRELVLSRYATAEAELESGASGHAGDPALLSLAASKAEELGIVAHAGPTLSSDVFYHPQGISRFEPPRDLGMIAVDMETAGLYAIAARHAVRALSICTVVDHIFSGEETHRSERQVLFGDMARLALEVARGAG